MAAALRSTAGLALRPPSRISSAAPANSGVRTMFTDGPQGGADGGWPDICFSFVALTGSCIFAWIAFDGDGPDGCIRGRGGGGRRGRRASRGSWSSSGPIDGFRRYPNLFKLISKRAVKQHTVTQALTERGWVADIKGALTVQVLTE